MALEKRLLGLVDRLLGKARDRVVLGDGLKLLIDLLECGETVVERRSRCKFGVFEPVRLWRWLLLRPDRLHKFGHPTFPGSVRSESCLRKSATSSV
jgi:hypothetical protein